MSRTERRRKPEHSENGDEIEELKTSLDKIGKTRNRSKKNERRYMAMLNELTKRTRKSNGR